MTALKGKEKRGEACLTPTGKSKIKIVPVSGMYEVFSELFG